MSQTDKPSRVDHKYPNIVRFVRETPWAILESKLNDITEMIALRAAGHELTAEEVQARIGSGPSRRDAYTTDGSTAVIPIYGVIVPRADLMSEISGGTSIERLQQSIRAAVSDPKVSAILLDVNSPGGSVAMLNEMAAEIRQARKAKPVYAIANTMAASAAYQLASQATELSVTPSGSVGSIGTIAVHDDISQMQEMMGVNSTVVTAGKFKGELSPLAPLSEEAKQHLQDTVDSYYGMFVADVAKGRGVTVDAVRSDYGQGRMLLAKDARAAGMVDHVETYDQILARIERAGKQQPPAAAAAHDRLPEIAAGPIKPHSTATVDTPWDGPGNKARLPNENGEKAYLAAFAWFDEQADDPNGDGYPDNKGDWKFIHHEVAENGDVGAANVNACSQGIGVLNGGRTGTTIPDGDRQGVWDHLARHLRDAGREPPPLKSLEELQIEAAASGLSFADAAVALRDSAGALVDRLASLAEVERGQLTKAKREPLTACPGALREAADAIDGVLAATNPDKHSDEAAGVFAQFLARTTVGG